VNYKITPTELLEYYFCPRFIYYMNVLKIPQYEDRRFKVQKGRNIHEKRMKENPDYLWKKLQVQKRLGATQLSSERLGLNGIPDDIVILEDNSYAPVDFKWAVYPDYVYPGHRIQIAAYAMLVEEIFQQPVYNGYIFYIRDGSKAVEVPITLTLKGKVLQAIKDILEIMNNEIIPDLHRRRTRCLDCTYRNICV